MYYGKGVGIDNLYFSGENTDMDIIRSHMPQWEVRERAFINKLAKMRAANTPKEQVEAAIEKYTQSVEKNLAKFSNNPVSILYHLSTGRKIIDPTSKPGYDGDSKALVAPIPTYTQPDAGLDIRLRITKNGVPLDDKDFQKQHSKRFTVRRSVNMFLYRAALITEAPKI